MADDKKDKKKNGSLFNRKSSTLETTFIETGVIGLDLHISNGRGIPVGGIIEFPAAFGTGKCHGKGTKILMYDGSIKNVEDVVVGDQLMGDDSTPRNVLSLARGRENMYKVIPKKGEPHICNESHMLSLKCSSDKIHIDDTTINISIRDYLTKSNRFKRGALCYKPQTPTTFAKTYAPLYDPYLLGLWVADGRKDRVSFSVNNGDKEIIDYLNECASRYSCTIKLGNIQENSKDISIAPTEKHNPIKIYLQSLGVLNNKHIPHELKTMSIEDRLQFLAGYIDGDGCKMKGNTVCFSCSSSNPAIIEGISFIARSLGFSSNYKYRERLDKRTNKTYKEHSLIIGGDIERIPVKLERKKIGADKTRKYAWNKSGFTLEELGEGDYYGFQVDGNHLYLLGDFIVTHNSTLNGEVAKRLILKHKNLGIPFKVAYIDIENSLDLLKSLGLQEFIESGDLIHIPGVVTYEELEEFYKDIFLKRVKGLEDVKLVIIDSITAVTTEKKDEMSCEGAEFGLKAKANTAFMEKLAPKSLQYGVTTLMINQMRDKQNAGMYEEKQKRQGGQAQGFYATAIIKLTKKTSKVDKDIKPIKIKTAFGEVDVQKKCIVTLTSDGSGLKNRYGKMQPVDILIEYGKKVHNWFTLRNMLIGLGYIEQSGSKFVVSEELGPEKADKSYSTKDVNTFVGQNIGRLVEFLKSRNQYRVNLEEIENDEFA